MKRAVFAALALAAACGGRTPFDPVAGEPSPAVDPFGAGGSGCAGCVAGAAGANAGASAGAGPAAGSGGCGARPGPPMIAIAETRGVRCVDVTEISNAHYAAFLASAPTVDSQPSACATNASFVPAFGWPAIGREGLPVVNVDWCDARAYCAWAGKVLCPGDHQKPADPARSAWMAACSRGGERAYPYGDGYSTSACNGKDRGLAKAVNTGSSAACEGGYLGLFDLSGNVWEWEDACDGVGPSAACLVRGGGFRNDALNIACGASFSEARDAVFDDFGFRCCAP